MQDPHFLDANYSTHYICLFREYTIKKTFQGHPFDGKSYWSPLHLSEVIGRVDFLRKTKITHLYQKLVVYPVHYIINFELGDNMSAI